MSRLIDDLLARSRIGHVRSEGTEVDVERLVRGIWDGFAPRLGPSACTFEVEPGLPHVLADEGRLAEVFENLLANAAKYACGAGATRVRVGGAVVGGETRFCVADDGPGIAPAYHERAFGLFQQLDSDRDGTGVGLAVVAKVMRVHGGRAWVESAEGAGATFWIAFPASARVPQARTPHARDGALVVEDNEIGFDEKDLDRIFTPFQRRRAREAYEGTGMGLAICRKIAERHGGAIRATSTPGEGSRFVVTLAADAA